jgi:predicted AAA+ superfamily ATPase
VYERTIRARLEADAANILLTGPRQVGKSTLLAGLAPDLAISLAGPATFRRYVARPELLEIELRAAPAGVRTVLIDEVQRIPELLDVVQVFADEQPGRFRFLLSGSSARKLKRGRANLLPGRIHTYSLHPLLVTELGTDFDLDRCLAHGTLPGVYAQPDREAREKTLRTYADTYLREEVQAEAIVRDIGGYARLLELVAATSGRILNARALSQQAGVPYETTRRYIEILEDTLVTFSVPAWSGSDRASLIGHPRIYMFDIGVRNALLRRSLHMPSPDERGYLVEHLVTYEIYRRLADIWPEAKLSHFRTRSGVEVDLVVEFENERWAIEVKAAWSATRQDLSGIHAFSDRAKRVMRKIVVFLGPRPLKIDDVEGLPLQMFLDELPT